MGDSQNFDLFTAKTVNQPVTKMFKVATAEILAERMPSKWLVTNTQKRFIHLGDESVSQARLPQLKIFKR